MLEFLLKQAYEARSKSGKYTRVYQGGALLVPSLGVGS